MARFVLSLVCSLLALIPQPLQAIGAEIAVLTLACWYLEIKANRGSIRAHAELQRPKFESMLESVVGEVQILPFLVGAVLLLAGRDSGYYCVAAGMLAILIFATLNIWVLLVEILR